MNRRNDLFLLYRELVDQLSFFVLHHHQSYPTLVLLLSNKRLSSEVFMTLLKQEIPKIRVKMRKESSRLESKVEKKILSMEHEVLKN